jgi:hypothetical protein
MKTIQNLCRQLLEFLRVGQEVILYLLIFVSAFFRNRASLGCELVAIRSQLTFYKESIRQKKPAATTVHPGIPSPVGAAVRGLEWVETCRSLDAAKGGSQMVSESFSPVVALEIAGHRRAPADPPGNACSDPTTQSRKCAVECREDSWAFAASRFRSSLPGYDSQVHGQAERRN